MTTFLYFIKWGDIYLSYKVYLLISLGKIIRWCNIRVKKRVRRVISGKSEKTVQFAGLFLCADTLLPLLRTYWSKSCLLGMHILTCLLITPFFFQRWHFGQLPIGDENLYPFNRLSKRSLMP